LLTCKGSQSAASGEVTVTGDVKIGLYLIGTVIAALGPFIIIAEFLRVHRIRSWHTAAGQIVASEVENDPESFSILVEYQYIVFGSLYKRKARIANLPFSPDKKNNYWRDFYSIGRTLQIAYNPERVDQSEIADEAQRHLNLSVIMVGVFLVAFAIIWTLGITR
jgi:hypothetical protein